MSGLRPIELNHFYARLHARGLSTTKLGELVGRTPGAVSRVLNGSRRKGPLWRRIATHLAPEEIELLHVAERSTWNKKRVAKRPRWDPALVAKT